MDFGGALQQIGAATTQATGEAMNSLSGFLNMGSGAANAVSRQAQANQFAYNSGEAAAQRAYNEAMWDRNAQYNSAQAEIARLFNSEEAAANREFQAAEAQKNRDWQERMANTAYQRAVTDLKAAGLNPILATMNGGANVGSGAVASGSQASGAAASSSPASSGMASGSNYTGQGNNMSGELAIAGMVASLIGSSVSALGEFMSTQNGKNTLEQIQDVAHEMSNGLDSIGGWIMDIATAGNWSNIHKYEKKIDAARHGIYVTPRR